MENILDNNDIKKEQLRCFICEVVVQGRYYYLATCRTQSSRSKVIEKLGELVGERYMVVISEDDVICRSCANHINTLDRLETEMRNVRDHVLKFLERKYCLEEGELSVNNDRSKPSHPPQITKRNATDISDVKQSKDDSEIYHRDQQQQMMKRSRSCLQCDKCKYTMYLNSFMIHRIRDHIKQKSFCDKYEPRASENQEETVHSCRTVVEQSGSNYMTDNPMTTNDNSIDLSLFHKVAQQTSLVQVTQTAPLSLIDASASEYISSMLLPEDNFPTSFKRHAAPFHSMQIADAETDVSSGKVMRISEKT